MKRRGAPRSFYLVNFGCPKNLVDGEGLAGRLVAAGVRQETDPGAAEVIVVNTCGFIGEAEAESREALAQFAANKQGSQKVVAAGCLSERRGKGLLQDIEGLDGLIGTKRWHEIPRLLHELESDRRPAYLGPPARPAPALTRLVNGPSAYVKIADGCNMKCSFCTIPSFKGVQRSQPIDRVLSEMDQLARRGVREAVLVAQELGSYGTDLDDDLDLVTLLKAVERSPGPDWVRLMYLYPTGLTERLLDLIAASTKLCKYIDVPVQHSSPSVLRRMRRPPRSAEIAEKMAAVRASHPDFAFRTTLIVGFPGETEADFEHLLQFVRAAEFDHIGVFRYSVEDGTPAASLPGQVDGATKADRYEAIMAAQQEVALGRRTRKIGREIEVLVEEVLERPARGLYRATGRSRSEAPEVDGSVFITGPAKLGDIVRAKVTGAEPYDLYASGPAPRLDDIASN